MNDRHDARLSTAATILIVVLLLGQIVLMAAHLWAPIARTADRLIVDENAPLIGEQAPGDEQVPEADGPALSSAWRWVALGIALVAAGTGLFATWRIREGSGERNRWVAVLVIAGLVIVWGIFTFRLIARSAIIFEGF